MIDADRVKREIIAIGIRSEFEWLKNLLPKNIKQATRMIYIDAAIAFKIGFLVI